MSFKRRGLLARAPRTKRSRRVFVSYRRHIGQAYAVAFHQRLTQVLGDAAVFLDVRKNALEAGLAWRSSVETALARSDTLLLVLAPGTAARLTELDDAVRFELETAIKHGLRVVLVRVEGAEVPSAAALPESLSDLPTLHSPVVHADSAVSDVDAVIEELTGRTPGRTSALNGRDLVVLGILASIGLIGWAVWGGRVLNSHQVVLWGSALLAPWFAWMAARRAAPSWVGMTGRREPRPAALWLALGLLLSIPWSIAFSRIYESPEFGADGGILVARFSDDPSDRLRDDFVQAIRAEIADPARASEFVKPFSQVIANRADAQKRAASTGAAAVLWGRATVATADSTFVVVHLYLEPKSLRRIDAELDGAVERRDLELVGDLRLIQSALPRLLEGYRLYRVAADGLGYENAATYFRSALASLEPAGGSAGSAFEKILSSIHFYQGNVFLLTSQWDSAATAFRGAVRHSLQEGDTTWPTYIEAVNNLGWLLAARGDPDGAIQELRRADRDCRHALRTACAYVLYNLGDAFLEAGQFDSASVRLSAVIAVLDTVERSSPEERDSAAITLRAYAHQSQSYGLVRQATASGPVDSELLERARFAWDQGRGTMVDAGLDVPSWFFITPARIQIARGQWSEAIAELSTLDTREPYTGIARGLLAGAYHCAGDVAKAAEVIGSMTLFPTASVAEGMAEATRISQRCAMEG